MTTVRDLLDTEVVKLTAQTEDTAPTFDDLIYTVSDPLSSPVSRKVALKNLPLALGWVDVRAYASINAAVTAIGVAQTTLLIPNTQTLAANLTIPSTLSLLILNGGSIVKASTYTLTINGPFEAGLYQVFSGFDAGDVTFGSDSVKEVTPQLWGGSPLASAAVNDTAFSCAFSAVGSTGIPIHIPAGTYNRTTDGIASTNSQFCVRGDGKYSSILSLTGTIDGIVLGQNDTNTHHVKISDLGIIGGRYGLRLNNIISSKFENIYLEGQEASFYTEGQIETCTFKNLYLNGFTDYGILTGQLNGGSNPSYNFPLLQKCEFDHIELRGASGSTSIRYTAGVYLTVQQISGYSSFKHIITQGEEYKFIDMDHVNDASFEHIQNETSPGLPANTYSLIKIGSNVGWVSIRDSQLVFTDYKYGIEQNEGFLYINNLTTSPADTADIYMNGVGGLIEETVVKDATTGIVFANDTVKSKTLLLNIYDSSYNPITVWPANTPFIVPSTTGVIVGSNLYKFSANKNNTNQTIGNATWTKVTFTTEEWDIAGTYDAANSKWVPGRLGYGSIKAHTSFAGAVDQCYLSCAIYKNGTLYKSAATRASGVSSQGLNIDINVDITALTDYFEVYVYQNSGGDLTLDGAIVNTYFMGHMLN